MKNTIIFSVLFLAACGNKSHEVNQVENQIQPGNTVALTAVQVKSANIQLVSLEQKQISSTIKVNGKIDVPPQNMVSVSMPLGGYLKSTKLLPGMHVRKGEIIATMEDQQYVQLQQDYLTTKAKLKFAASEFERQKELNKTQASSDKVFQQAQMEYSTHKVALSALAEKLKLINISPQNLSENNLSKSVHVYAPINGFVSKVNVNIGKYLNPADVLFELVNPEDIHLNLRIYEKDLDKISIGQKLFAYSNHQPDQKHLCEIILISKDLSASRSAEVHCHFEKYDKFLLPGMYMNAEIEVESNHSGVLPEESVVSFEGKNYVFLALENNRFKMTAVETGDRENGFMEIKNSQVLAGKKIAGKGAYTLLMTLKNKSDE